MGILSGKLVRGLTFSALIIAILSPFIFFTSPDDYEAKPNKDIKSNHNSKQELNTHKVLVEKTINREEQEAYYQSIAKRKEQVDAAVESIAKNSRLYLPPMLSSKAIVIYFTVPQEYKDIKQPNSNYEVKEANSNINASIVDSMTGPSFIGSKENIVNGVEYLAKIIQEKSNASISNISTVKSYPLDSHKLYEVSLEEQNYKNYPELTDDDLLNLNDFDTVYLCYPNWWRDMPGAIYSFLRKYDLSNKTIIPITIHNGDGFSNTINEIALKEPHAIIYRDGLLISQKDLQDQELTNTLIDSWLKRLAQNFE